MFTVSGEDAREVLAKLCRVDMAPGAFESGQFRRTRMAQTAAAFWTQENGSIRIICFRSVAGYGPYIHLKYEAPIKVRFTRRNSKTVRFNWTLPDMELSNMRHSADASYSAILNTTTGRISMRVLVTGNDDDPRGSGRCALLKQ